VVVVKGKTKTITPSLLLSTCPREKGVMLDVFEQIKSSECLRFKEAQNSNISVRCLGSSAQLAR